MDQPSDSSKKKKGKSDKKSEGTPIESSVGEVSAVEMAGNLIRETPVEAQKAAEPESEQWRVPAAHHIAHDPLLGCLVVLTRLEHNPFSPETLIAGLPLVDNKLTPELFIRAAARAGLSAQIVSRTLADISPLVLPAVLLLKNRQACILVSKNDAKGTATIIQPESKQGERVVSLAELSKQYTGYSIFSRPAFRFDKRSDEGFKERPKNWFWSVIATTWKIYSEVLVASFFINVFAIASSLFVMNVYDRVVPNNAMDTLTVLSVGVLIVFTFDFIMKMLRGYFIDIAAKKTDVILSSSIFEQMMGIKMEARPNRWVTLPIIYSSSIRLEIFLPQPLSVP